MKNLICFLLLITNAVFVYSQDTIKKTIPLKLADDLQIFDSETEKNFLNKKEFKQSDYLDLYLLIGSKNMNQQALNKIESFIAANSQQSYKGKDLKKLYKNVHETFFTQYVDNPAFYEIFETGKYNCATASALYALILDKLAVGYSIREKPTHVYIVADPGTSNVVFETTAPGMKTLQLDDKFKSRFIEFLADNKIITSSEAVDANKNALFEKYFYGDEKINLRQLAGILFYNFGVDAMLQKNNDLAYKNFEKAYLLYPSKRIEYFTTIALASLVFDNAKESNPLLWAYYLRYSQLSGSENGIGLLKSFWGDLLNKNLFESPKPDFTKSTYRKLVDAIDDTSLKKNIQYDYYYNMAHYLDIKNKIDSSLLFLDSAYSIKPDNLLLQELITNVTYEHLRTSLLSSTDTATFKITDGYFKRFPFIDKTSKLGDLYILQLSVVTADLYRKDHIKAGDRYFAKIMDMMDKNLVQVKKNEVAATGAIIEKYYYHIRHKQYKDAKTFLEKVAKYLPDNDEVNRRLKNANNILSNP